MLHEKDAENKNREFDTYDGKVKIVNGEIIVTNPKSNGKPAKIHCDKQYKIFLNDIEILTDSEIFENSNIKIEFPNSSSERKISVTTSDDGFKAFISIEYIPKIIYSVENCEECNNLLIKIKEIDKQYPLMYNIEDIMTELDKNKIKYGIIKENIKKGINDVQINNMLIAEGIKPQDSKDDYIDIKFDTDEDIKELKEDINGKVDFKSIGAVNSVKKDEVVAEVVSGKDGINGTDVFGREIKCRQGKKIHINVGQGCLIQNTNTVVATMDGRPFFKNNTFYIYQVYKVSGDVDITTGNVNFIGDICINGDVKEGMKVNAGNSVEIDKDVERALITAKGNVTIKGNIISSQIVGGGEDMFLLNQIHDYTRLIENLKNIINTIEEVKKYNLLGYNTTDGQIIKVLIENKFKDIPKCCMKIIKNCVLNMEKQQEEMDIVAFIKGKLIGLGPLTIKNYGEIFDLMKTMEKRIEALKLHLSLPVDVKVYYCQESNVVSSGNVVVSGKGAYVSEIYARGSVLFTQKDSIIRGGLIKAGNEIKSMTVGSQSGVSTKLIVGEKGHIYADFVYENTQFMVGTKEYKVEEACKSVHVYLNELLDITVDKFKP